MFKQEVGCTKNKETAHMNIISFTKYYRIEKFRKNCIQTEKQMGENNCKKNGSMFYEGEGRGIIIYLDA